MFIKISQNTNPHTFKFISNIDSDFAKSRLKLVPERFVRHIFAKDGPRGMIVADDVIGRDDLESRWRLVETAVVLSWAERHFGRAKWARKFVPYHNWEVVRAVRRPRVPPLGLGGVESVLRLPGGVVEGRGSSSAASHADFFDLVGCKQSK
jgi:hypothetical protein